MTLIMHNSAALSYTVQLLGCKNEARNEMYIQFWHAQQFIGLLKSQTFS